MTQELIRGLRGASSQRAMSTRLGYTSNVFYAWESGRRSPTAAELLRLAAFRGIEIHRCLRQFSQAPLDADLDGAERVAEFLRSLQGKQTTLALAEASGKSRYQIMRWLSGQSEPKASDALAFIEAATMRAVDFVAMLVAPSAVPSIQDAWRELEARRSIATTLPWSQAILRAMELAAYRESPTHRPGWVAHTVGISMAEEAQCIEALEGAGLIRWNGRRYDLTEATVDTSAAPDRARLAVKRHWLDVARAQVGSNESGLYSYNVVSLSRADLEKLRRLHVEYFQSVRSIVADSDPECVALVAMQLFEFGASGR